jgi:hypothetical protein
MAPFLPINRHQESSTKLERITEYVKRIREKERRAARAAM